MGPSSPESKDMIASITSPSSSDTSSDSGMALSPLEFGGFDLDFSEELSLYTFDLGIFHDKTIFKFR